MGVERRFILFEKIFILFAEHIHTFFRTCAGRPGSLLSVLGTTCSLII